MKAHESAENFQSQQEIQTMTELPLTTFRFDPNTCIPQAQPKLTVAVTQDSSALDVMTDLAVIKAETIAPHITLAEAQQVMIHRGVRALFVTEKFPCIDGLITATDILGEKPLKLVTNQNIKFQNLKVREVMTELSDLNVVDYDEVKNALVSNVMATFKKLKCTHIVVVQAAKIQGPARIRGLISQTQMDRQLASNTSRG
jgi:CBS-domain-containing membrane protein